jgi:acetyl esterase/lipase
MSLSRRDLVKSPLVLAGASAIGVGAATKVFAQSGAAGASEVIGLWPRPPAGAVHPDLTEVIEQTSSSPGYSSRRTKGVSKPYMIALPAAQPNGSAMLIIPGGGFEWNYFDHEGYHIADVLNRAGITCFVLIYRLARDGWADPATVGPADAQRAMRLIRANAPRFHLDPERVGVMGFSAGGVAPSLFGGQPTAAQIREWSPDLNVTPAAAPTFLVHAEDDNTVPVANTVRLREAMVAAKIRVETHLFARGGHGFGVGPRPGGPDGLWLPLFVNFARQENLFV